MKKKNKESVVLKQKGYSENYELGNKVKGNITFEDFARVNGGVVLKDTEFTIK